MATRTKTANWAETTIASLQAKGHRSGGARRAVVELLGRQHCCLTAQEIFDQLRAEGRRVGTASVYRALEQLTRDGFVQRIDIGAGTSRFEPIHAGGEHHHHLVCRSCGRVEEIDLAGLDLRLSAIARKRGYASLGHTVEIAGICADCREDDT